MNSDTHPFDVLRGHKYMNFTTFRKKEWGGSLHNRLVRVGGRSRLCDDKPPIGQDEAHSLTCR